jgi:flagellar L-ring protein precursor FlgH
MNSRRSGKRKKGVGFVARSKACLCLRALVVTSWLGVSVGGLAAGCAHTRAAESAEAEEARVLPTPADPAGSIWRQGAASHFFDRKARNVGDIVTVKIVEKASAAQEASTESDRTAKMDASMDDIFGLPQNLGMTNFLGSGQPFSPSLKGDYARDFKGSGKTTRKNELVLTVTATVVEVLPSGNLRIRGQREVKVNREKQTVFLEGVIRPEDISPFNSVVSTQIADARIKYTGRGVLGDVQGPGWLSRIMDWIWPL